MKRVYKYLLHPGITTLDLPVGTSNLSVHEQNEEVFLWALIDPSPNLKTTERHFCVYGTGHDINESIVAFIGSVHMYNGTLVFHAFEVKA